MLQSCAGIGIMGDVRNEWPASGSCWVPGIGLVGAEVFVSSAFGHLPYCINCGIMIAPRLVNSKPQSSLPTVEMGRTKVYT